MLLIKLHLIAGFGAVILLAVGGLVVALIGIRFKANHSALVNFPAKTPVDPAQPVRAPGPERFWKRMTVAMAVVCLMLIGLLVRPVNDVQNNMAAEAPVIPAAAQDST